MLKRPKLSKFERFKLVANDFIKKHVLLDLIGAETTQCAFKNYRNPRVRLMIVFLFIQKLFTFVYLIKLQLKSTQNYISEEKQ